MVKLDFIIASVKLAKLIEEIVSLKFSCGMFSFKSISETALVRFS